MRNSASDSTLRVQAKPCSLPASPARPRKRKSRGALGERRAGLRLGG